jgi:hypothetical protein
MFESIVSKITNVIRESGRALGAATRSTPWLAPLAILAVFLVLK